MKTKLFVLAAALGLMLAAVPAWAHHAFAAEFDLTKPLLLKGTVTKMKWINPHAWIHLDVKNQGWHDDQLDDRGGRSQWAAAPRLQQGFAAAGDRYRGGRLAGQGRYQSRQREQYHLPGWKEAVYRIAGNGRSHGQAGQQVRRTGIQGNTRETRNTLRIRRGDFAIQPIADYSEDLVIVFLQQHQVAVAENSVIAQTDHLGASSLPASEIPHSSPAIRRRRIRSSAIRSEFPGGFSTCARVPPVT